MVKRCLISVLKGLSRGLLRDCQLSYEPSFLWLSCHEPERESVHGLEVASVGAAREAARAGAAAVAGAGVGLGVHHAASRDS